MNRITRSLLAIAICITAILATGCGESPVGNDPQNNGGDQNGAVNNFIIDGDGYSDTEFAATGVFANVGYGTAAIGISGTYDGQPATLAIAIEPASKGTHQLNYTNFIKVTIAKGVPRYYVSSNGSVTITDVGTQSGVIKGSYSATLLRDDTGARVTAHGTFEIPRS